MRQTKFEREINIFTTDKGLLVEQSPGYQTIHYSDNILSKGKEYIYSLPMPWVRFWRSRTNNRYHAGWGHVQLSWAMQSWKYERKSGLIKGYDLCLPCVMPSKSVCGVNVGTANVNNPTNHAMDILQSIWGSGFCGHWEDPNTWSSPFWKSFGVKRPPGNWASDICATDHAIHEVFGKWEKLSLEEVASRPHSDYRIVATDVTLVEG